MKEFEAHYNPQFESSDGIERRMKTAIAREQEQAEKDRAAKTLVVAAQVQSGWKEDREAI